MHPEIDPSNELLAHNPTPDELASVPTPTPEPAGVAPTPNPSTVTEPVLTPNRPGTIITQWLTYAFWGWTIVAIVTLIAIVLSFTLVDALSTYNDGSESIIYAVAAIIVLAIISFICDFFFGRKETTHKHGAAGVIMIVHTVLFSLVGIGSLITTVFSGLNIVVSGPSTPATITLITSISGAVLFGLLIIRTVLPSVLKKFGVFFKYAMLVIITGLCIWAFVGPIGQASKTKDDRAVTSNLTTANSLISGYVSEKSKLPATLDEAISGDYGYSSTDSDKLKDLVKRGLITYKANVKDASSTASTELASYSNYKTYYYELCGTYKYARNDSGKSETTDASNEFHNYTSFTGNVKVGENCYRLSETDYSDNDELMKTEILN